MTGVGGIRISVTPHILSEHNTEEDCWTAIRGRITATILMLRKLYYMFAEGVVTAYLPFHPGGVSELMKGAGIDYTMLFNNVSDIHILLHA